MSESFNFSIYEDNNNNLVGYEITSSYTNNFNTFGNVLDSINFRQSEPVINRENLNITFGDILNAYMGDIFQQTNIRYIDPIEIAIEESLNNYKHAEKKPIKLEINTQKFSETEKKHTTCTICQDDFTKEDNVCILECNHYFHEKCISEWGKYKPECPNCQKSIKYFMEKEKE